MKVKLKMMIVLGVLFIVSPIYVSASYLRGSVNIEKSLLYGKHGRWRKAKTHLNVNHGKRKSILSCSAYVEDNILYLHFDTPLENVLLDITNVDTGVLIFSGEFTGTSLALPLQEDGYEFNINVDQF